MNPARHFSSMVLMTGYGSSSTLVFDKQQYYDHEGSQAAPQNDFYQRSGDEDLGNRSDGENFEAVFGDEQLDPSQNAAAKKKRYHRHTQHQIQELEAFYKECPHPDDRQRKELGRELGLEPLQIKFWFQNKRTQMKAKLERNSNEMLRAENDKLRAENLRYKEALNNTSCPNCGGPAALGEMSFDEQQLRMENAKLKEEIDRILGLAAKHAGKSTESQPLFNASVMRSLMNLDPGVAGAHPGINGEMFSPRELLKTVVAGTPEMERPLVIELALHAMEELMKMAQVGEPLWFSGYENATDVLNGEEYERAFSRRSGLKSLGWRTEATRGDAIVMMSPASLVEILMDANEWAAVYSGIVSRAVTMEVLSTGVAGNYNGALQVMVAEYQLATPLVPIRECLFVRYCKQHSDGIWAVVDASLDTLRSTSPTRCLRHPSGCLIQDISNGYSKVTWVEHVEVDDRSIHPLYRCLVNSGLAFGAKRWLETLERLCERLASTMAHNFTDGDIGGIATPQGRKNLLKLSERMVVSFFGGVTASSAYQWEDISDASNEDVKVSMRKCANHPGRPYGHVISAATSLWLPVAPRILFDFLRDETSRNEWDILSNNAIIQEVGYISNGPEQGNCVSVLRVGNKDDILILQESCFNTTGSYVIYAPVDVEAMSLVLSRGDPDYVALLPSGFAVLPDGPAVMHGGVTNELGSGGSLLTIAFQIIVDSPDSSDLILHSVATVNQLISCTREKIKSSILGEDIQKT